MSELPKESVDTPKRGRIAQILAMCAALAGCAGNAQNAEVRDSMAEVDNKPEWVDGPSVFKKDGKIYGVGSKKFSSARGMSIATKDAELIADTLISAYIDKNKAIDGENVTTEYIDSSGSGASSVDSYIEDNSDGTATKYVLMRRVKE